MTRLGRSNLAVLNWTCRNQAHRRMSAIRAPA